MEKPILIKDLGMMYATENSIQKKRYGLYRCKCGNEFMSEPTKIKSGHTSSCGCYKRERTSILKTTHGLRGHRLYQVWKQMIRRVSNEKDVHYNNYGGRGITVCDRWIDINSFISDMDCSYEKGLTIDRINNDGNYEPSNCRWATRSVQSCNVRTIRSNNTTGYRGVVRDGKKFLSRVTVNKQRIRIGLFDTAIEAGMAYDNYVIKNKLEHNHNNIERICNGL